jgi:hypothetical protein
MSATSREFLMIVEESAYGTPAASPVVWTQSTAYGLSHASAYYIRLPGDNQFTMRMRPTGIVRIPYGGGVATDAAMLCDKQECKGQLTCHLSISQAPFLLSWAGVPSNGSTTPWTYTATVGDLLSCSIYHAIIEFDGTVKRTVYPGCKVDAWSIGCSEGSTIATLTLQISGQKATGNTFDSSSDPTSGTFPEPTDANLPIDIFEWIHTSGAITIGGEARANITELNIACTNKLARSWYNSRYIQYLALLGQDLKVSSRLQYVSTVNDRQLYYQLAAEAMSIGFNNGTHGFVLNCNSTNIYDPLEDDLKLADTYYQTQTSNTLWDVTAGSLYGLTFS